MFYLNMKKFREGEKKEEYAQTMSRFPSENFQSDLVIGIINGFNP